MAQEFTNNCLICGEEQTGKSWLLNQVMSNPKWIYNDDKTLRSCQWEASNKYYSANVNFTIINNVESMSKVPNKDTQALLLFINLNQPKAQIRDDLASWHHSITNHFNTNEIDSQFLLGNYISNNKADHSTDLSNVQDFKKLHDELNMWCVDNQFEFIPSPYTPNNINNTNNNNNNDGNGSNITNIEQKVEYLDDNDTNISNSTNSNDFDFSATSDVFSNYDNIEMGAVRIDAALQCVMWPDMQRKPLNRPNRNNQRELENNINQDRVSAESAESDAKNMEITRGVDNEFKELNELNESKDSNEEKEEAETTETIIESTNENNGVRNALSELNNKEIVDTLIMEKMRNDSNENGMNQVTKSNSKNNDNKNNNNNSLEASMTSFESIIDEMRKVREASKSGNLSNEERRERAAKTAMKLASMLDLENASDDNDDNNNDGDGDGNENMNEDVNNNNNSNNIDVNKTDGDNGRENKQKGEVKIAIPYLPGKHPASQEFRAKKMMNKEEWKRLNGDNNNNDNIDKQNEKPSDMVDVD